MSGARIKTPPVFQITLVQCVILFLTWLGLRWDQPLVASSLVYGGAIAVIPQAYFATRLFRQRGAQAATRIARAGYAGEVGKFFLSAAGFAAVFAGVRPIEGWAVFVGYGVMVVIHIAGTWRLMR